MDKKAVIFNITRFICGRIESLSKSSKP